MKTRILLTLFIAISFMQLSATNFNVTNANDAGPGSLRQAIDDANLDLTSTESNPHTITPDASYTISNITNLKYFTHYVILNPTNFTLTINAVPGVRTMYVDQAAENYTSVVLNNIVFQGTNDAGWAAAFAVGGGSKAVLNNCTFQYNSSKYAAIANGGDLTCNNCSFHDNVSTGIENGGIIVLVNADSKIKLSNCIIENNTGGPAVKGMLFSSGYCTIDIDNCIIRNNLNEGTSGINHGCGISSAGKTTISNSEISGNSAERGAGVSLLWGNAINHSRLIMINCTVSGNTATKYDGGGVWIQGSTSELTDSVTLTNCTISGNTSKLSGAGFKFNSGSVTPLTNVATLNNCTITGNNVDDGTLNATGGGVDRSVGNVILNYCIVAGNNTASTNIAKDIKVLSTALGSTTGRNLYGGKPVFDMVDAVTTGNIQLTDDIVINVLKENLADNAATNELPGGSHLLTHAIIDGSLAINPSCAAIGIQTTDQRGVTRDATPDMGAYEFVAQTVSPKVINAISVNYIDVKDAVALAVVGDTIQIPAGTGDWGTSSLAVGGGICIRGAGKNFTVIKRTASTTDFLIKFYGSNSKPSTLSDLTLEGFYGDDLIYSRGVGLWNGCVNFKIFNCKFKGFADCAVYVGNSLVQRGVIYNNDFIDNFYSSINNLGYGVVVYGDGSWPTLELGSENAVYVEDNYFSGNRHNIASNNGSRYVFRFNNAVGQDPVRNYAMTDAHGLSSWPSGSRSFEIYNNNYSSAAVGLQRSAIGIRGGDGVIFNNKCTNGISRTIELSQEGFPCGDYPGANQIRSLYIWNNEAHDELGYTVGGIANNCETSIQLNRDYFATAMPNYTSYTYPHPLRPGGISGIFQINQDQLISVYPNPFVNSISIKSDKTIEKVVIVNIQGQEVLYKIAKSSHVDISNINWVAGVYFVKAQIAGKWSISKLFKQ